MAKDQQQTAAQMEEQESKEELRALFLEIRNWWKYLLSRWKLIVCIGVLGGVIGFLYAQFSTPSYDAEVNFVLEDSGSGSGAGGLSGLASMVGISMDNGGGVFQSKNIAELYQSRRMLTTALLSSDRQGEKLLIDRYMRMNEIREGWEDQPELLEINFDELPEPHTRVQDSILGKFVENIRENYLKIDIPEDNPSLVNVGITSKDEEFSKEFVEALVGTVNEFYVETRTKKSKNDLDILKHQTDSVRKALDQALKDVAVSREQNFNPNPSRAASLGIASTKNEIDAQVNQAMLQELIKNLELAKINFRKDKPLIQILDHPVLPLKPLQPGRIKSTIIGGIIAGFLIVLFLVAKEYYRQVMEEDDFEEVKGIEGE